MFSMFFSKLFQGKKPKPGVLSPPKYGEQWEFIALKGEDPFPPKHWHIVKILEVKAGWVRYHMSSVFPDERMRLSSFLTMYQFYK